MKGLITEKLLVCEVCRAIATSQGIIFSPAKHLISPKGYLESDLCPSLLALSPMIRADVLAKANMCRICLRSNMLPHEATCPTLDLPSAHHFVCSFQGCNKRKIVCGNKNHLQVDEQHKLDNRYDKAREAGIAVTALTQVMEAREALVVFEEEHRGELLQCQVGTVVDTDEPPDST